MKLVPGARKHAMVIIAVSKKDMCLLQWSVPVAVVGVSLNVIAEQHAATIWQELD